MIDSPFGGAPAKAPRWDLADIEGYGDGNSFSWCSSMVSGYVCGYILEEEVDRWMLKGPTRVGARPPP